MSAENKNLVGLKVLLGVSGGVSAYKSVDLASKLTGAGVKVRTVMTGSACHFIGHKSFEAVTGQPVYSNLWTNADEHKISHISLCDWADIVVVAPATANIIGKIANGICDDLLSTTVCACWEKAVLLAPAMNDKMWSNPAVQRNVKHILEMGIGLIGPAKGRLACGTEGLGRMVEAAEIIKSIEKIASQLEKNK